MNKTRAAIAKNGAESAWDSWYGFTMLESSTYLESKTYHSSDGDARITVTPVQRVDHGVIIDMEVSLNPDTRKGAIPNKWSVSWINYANVIEENFTEFVEKYCPEPEKILTLFRELRMDHLSQP